MRMKVNGLKYPTLAVFPSMMTVPDCIVVQSNKLGSGHGEAKFYISSKDDMHEFYGPSGFEANCFMLKVDLLAYLDAIKNEYFNPSQEYARKNDLPTLWGERRRKVLALDDVITFEIHDQTQIAGPRGYVKSSDDAYKLLREIALPLVSYVYVEKLGNEEEPLFYWKLFVDFEAIWEKQSTPLVFHYGKEGEEEQKNETPSAIIETNRKEISYARIGQGKYREQLLEQCAYCPFTKIADERLLIASHIKPWSASSDFEKTDPYNGYILSPLYDKLFDKGFITFTPNRHVILSEFLSPFTWGRIGLKNDTFISALPMDDRRAEYLKFHHTSVFKGSVDFDD